VLWLIDQSLMTMRITFLFYAAFVLCASAQVNPSFFCTTNAGIGPLVRAEGLSERVGDLVLNCSGGIPTASGVPVPTVDIQAVLNTNMTSRLLSDPLSEALLLIDDPDPAQQVVCIPGTTPGSTSTSCPVLGVGSGPGVNFKAGAAPNVYQGRKTVAGGLSWLGIPVDPSGANATRTFRITNVRANVSEIGLSSTLIPLQIYMYISTSAPQLLPIMNPTMSVALISSGMSFSLRKADNSGVTNGINLLKCADNNKDISGDNTKPLNGTVNPGGVNNISFIARFTEGFASSFTRRNIAPVVPSGPGSQAFNADLSPSPKSQDSPSGICLNCSFGQFFTETGFYNQNFPVTNGLNRAGLADTGTRLLLRFASVPPGTQVFAGIYELGGTAATSKLRLISTNSQGEGTFSPVSATSNPLSGPALAPIPIVNGSGAAVYEVINSVPVAIENFDVPIAVAYSANTPEYGTATIDGSFAPLSIGASQSSDDPVPRFVNYPTRKTAFIIGPCPFQGADSAPLTFVATAPCRLVDTRPDQGQTGAFGPPMLSGATRIFPLPSHPTCNVSPTAVAYSLNFTAIPVTTLDFLSAWATGGVYPGVSTLNAPQGGIVANAAIVPAGTNGGIDVVAGNDTHLIIDIDGYFAPQQTISGTALPTIGNYTTRFSNVKINNGKNQAKVVPGAQFTVNLDYQITDPGSAVGQIEIGYADRATKEICAYSAAPGPLPGAVGTATVTMTAPVVPGIYYIATDRGQDTGCKTTTSNWWNGPRNASHYIGAIAVY
jgi:hypothetical protein